MESEIKKTLLWEPNGIYTNHRIPGMTVTDKGTVLTVCEARRSVSDWARMDILLKRSTDFGETFSEPVILAKGTKKLPTANNPVMMQDKKGRIHFLYCENYGINGGRIFRRYSDDDGVTWSRKIDITSATVPEYRNVFAIGPGHGICLENGTLVVPVWLVPKRLGAPLNRHTPSEISTLYSLDNGKSWQLGDILQTTSDVISPNETEAAQLSDGRVYLNIRHLSMTRCNAVSPNGYLRWSGYGMVGALPDPQCFGSVVSYDDGKNPYSLIFANCASKVRRDHVTVRKSVDDGKTWSAGTLLEEKMGGYVETAADSKNGWIYVIYEDNYGEHDTFVRLRYENIK